MAGMLETLLVRIRDGLAAPAEVASARELLQHDARVPEDLRELELLTDDPAGDAAGLLAVLGADDLSVMLRSAIEAESEPEALVWSGEDEDAWAPLGACLAGGLARLGEHVDVSARVMRNIPADWAYGSSVSDAVASEAGSVSVLEAVEGGLLPVAAAVRAHAGEVEVAASVCTALALEALPIAQAVASEAGSVELAGEVSRELALPLVDIAGAVAFEAGEVSVLGLVLAELGLRGEAVAEATRAEAGGVEVAAHVARSVGETVQPVAEAVRAEAGEVDVRAPVAVATEEWLLGGLLDHELDPELHRAVAQGLMRDRSLGQVVTEMADLGRSVRNAVAAEAGEVSVWDAVGRAIGLEDPEAVPGWDEGLVPAAVGAEAGSVDVLDAVMRDVLVDRSRSTADGELPSSLPVEDLELERPANNPSWVWGAVLMAAVAIMVAGLGPYLSADGLQDPLTDGAEIAAIEESTPLSVDGVPMQFASAGEVTIEDLSYAEDLQVFQTEGDDGAVIIWIEEEA